MRYSTCRCIINGCQCVTPSYADICPGCELGLHVAMMPVRSDLASEEQPTRWSLLRARADDGKFLPSGQS